MVGTFSQYLEKQLVVPGWAWTAVGAGLLFWTACRIEWELLAEKDKSRKAEPSMQLEEVVKRIRGKDDIFGRENSESMEVMRALQALREKAQLGLLEVYGRKGWRSVRPAEYDLIPRVRIPVEYISEHWVSYIEFIDDRRGELSHDANSAPGEYIDIWFDRAQVEAMWPPRRFHLSFRNPI